MTCDVLMDFDTLLNPSAFEFLNASKLFKSNNGDLRDRIMFMFPSMEI